VILISAAIVLLLISGYAFAEPGINIVTSAPNKAGGQTYTITIKILFLMTAMMFLPAVVMLTTSFARIVIVLSILRQALGTPQTPSTQIIIGLALFLSFFIMAPVLDKAYTTGAKPYLEEKITAEVALERVKVPFKNFMLKQTRKTDLQLFLKLAKKKNVKDLKSVPMSVLIPAFITSELKTAFQIGFLIFIPFIVIDLVVASVLMSMGMMMLSPMLVALPFKLMLFVLVDGWALIVGTLAASFVI
jgi:flagellar biosynthetic protein FliP